MMIIKLRSQNAALKYSVFHLHIRVCFLYRTTFQYILPQLELPLTATGLEQFPSRWGNSFPALQIFAVCTQGLHEPFHWQLSQDNPNRMWTKVPPQKRSHVSSTSLPLLPSWCNPKCHGQHTILGVGVAIPSLSTHTHRAVQFQLFRCV